jgi:hypothetical protein
MVVWQIRKLAPMGVLASGTAHARPSTQPPIDTSGNFPANLSAESPSNIEKHWKKIEKALKGLEKPRKFLKNLKNLR